MDLLSNPSIKLAATINDIDPVGIKLDEIASQILNRIPFFLGGLALLALLYSGFLYLTAFGDAAKMEQAKKNISWTIIGIIVIASTSIIITIILRVIGSTHLEGIV